MPKDKERAALRRAEKLALKAAGMVGKATSELPRVSGRAVRLDDLDRLGKALRRLSGEAQGVGAHVDRLRTTLVAAASAAAGHADGTAASASWKRGRRGAATTAGREDTGARRGGNPARASDRTRGARRSAASSAGGSPAMVPASRPLPDGAPLQPPPPAPPPAAPAAAPVDGASGTLEVPGREATAQRAAPARS